MKNNEWLTDKEKRILFAALTREKKVCIEVDKEVASERGMTNSKLLQSICESLEDKFYFDTIFREIEKKVRNDTINEFLTEICKIIVQSESNGNYRFYAVEIKQAIADLAEQLENRE